MKRSIHTAMDLTKHYGGSTLSTANVHTQSLTPHGPSNQMLMPGMPLAKNVSGAMTTTNQNAHQYQFRLANAPPPINFKGQTMSKFG